MITLTMITMIVVVAAVIDYGIYLMRLLDWKTDPARKNAPRQIPPDDLIGRVKV